MMRRKLIYLVMSISLGTVILWLTGLIWALDSGRGTAIPVAAPIVEQVDIAEPAALVGGADDAAQRAKDGQLRVIAFGDSLTKGTGDVTGGGYAGYVFAHLQKVADKLKQKAVYNNLGVDGMISAELVELLQKPEVIQETSAADVILLSIGGNDLFKGGQTLVNQNQAEIDAIQSDYLIKLEQIQQQIRQANATAPLMIVGLYNPFATLKDAAWTNEVVRKWNAAVAEQVAGDQLAVLVPSYDLFQLDTNVYLHGDQFHPNAAGYQRMAERFIAALPMRLNGGKLQSPDQPSADESNATAERNQTNRTDERREGDAP
jgi:lysophospholipase L1-like esterase